jgi:hypothetical protein
MKENTKIMLRRESGHWNKRNSNVASSPKKIPLKIATVRMEGRKLGVPGSERIWRATTMPRTLCSAHNEGQPR